ncbi:MAG: PEP/pyruvate-binding domain-containing protein [Caldilineaceae bacterium]
MDILWLDHPQCQEVRQVGGKVANLSRLAAKHRVPPGFCLTTQAFTQWPTAGTDRTIPPVMIDQITAAYADLAARSQIDAPRVAVRSSAVDEDGQGASFAGQFETYLNIVGAPAVVEAVQHCWASAHNPRVQAYRAQQGQADTPVQLAVLVQQLVVADWAAVVFSANPLTGSRNEIVINASWGLGESIVGGTVTPDTVVLRKTDFRVIDRTIADKRRMTILATTGAQEVAVPRPMRNQPAVTDAQAREMADLARTLEATMGWPVDVECAYANEALYLLQCRPITTLP